MNENKSTETVEKGRYLRDGKGNVYERERGPSGFTGTLRRVGFYLNTGQNGAREAVTATRKELPKNKKERRKARAGLTFQTK